MIKRVLDIALSLAGLVILGPLLAMIALFTKILDPGPVFYRAVRVGRGGREFVMFKFRTMVVRADQIGAAITVGGDPRVTRMGHWLRRFKLDELPQLFNVLVGEMSFVGPRPEVALYVRDYTPEQRRVLGLRPGITDLASFAFYNESDLLARAPNPDRFYREVLVGEKIRINLAYAARANLVTDVILIFATVVRGLGVKVDLFRWFNVDPPQAVAQI